MIRGSSSEGAEPGTHERKKKQWKSTLAIPLRPPEKHAENLRNDHLENRRQSICPSVPISLLRVAPGNTNPSILRSDCEYWSQGNSRGNIEGSGAENKNSTGIEGCWQWERNLGATDLSTIDEAKIRDGPRGCCMRPLPQSPSAFL